GAGSVATRVVRLVHEVYAGRGVGVDRLADVESDAPVLVRAGLKRSLVDGLAVGVLEGAVEDAAAGAAAEGQHGRASDDLDALGVIQVAEVLDVVAEAVDEEVGAGVDAADHEFVAVAFALVDGDAGNVARHIGDLLEVLVP